MKKYIVSLILLTSFISIGSAVARADITTGLIGSWNFDQGSGSMATDNSGNGNNGTLSGSTLPAWVTGVVGSGALSFNGQSSYVDLGTNPALSGGNAITVSAWIKPNALNGYIVTHGQWNASWDLFLTNGRINFDMTYNNDVGAWSDVSILTSYPINTSGNYWTHVVATYTCNNGAGSPACTSGTPGQVSVYINGVQDTGAVVYYHGQPQTGYTGGSPIYTGSLDTRIGARYQDLPQMTPSPFPLFSGSIDDVRVYSRALSPSDITALYGLGVVPAPSKNIYISQSGSGMGDGSSCSNSYSVNWLNSFYTNTVIEYPLSWDPVVMPGQIYPGVTVYLCGAISTGLNIPGSGTADNPITIKFDPGTNAKLSAPAFTTAISGYNVSYITIDGCYGSEDTNGICDPTGVLDAQGNDTSRAIIENTNNGSPYEYWPQYCNSVKPSLWGRNSTVCNNIVNNGKLNTDPTYPDYQQTNTTAIALGGSNNIIIKNLVMQGLYNRAPSSGDPSGGFGGYVTQDELEYSCSSSGVPVSCNETTPSGLTWSNVVQKLVSNGWATQPISTILVSTSQYNNDASLEQDMTGLFGSDATALYIMNIFSASNAGARPGASTAISVPGASNVLIQNNMIRMSETGIDIPFASGQQNVKIDSTQILGFNHGIEMGAGAVFSPPYPTLNGLIISNNRLDGMDVWEDANISPMNCTPFNPPTCGYYDIGFHRDPIFLFLTSSNGLLKNIDIYNNHIGPGFDPQTDDSGTAAIFEDVPVPSTQVENLRVYNNIFDLKSPMMYADGFGGAIGMNALFANNTIVGGGGVGGGGQNSYIYNNLKISGSTGLSMRDNDISNPPFGQPGYDPSFWYLVSEFSDYNLLSGIDPNNSNAFNISSVVSPDGLMGYATWQGTGTLFDAHSLFGLNLNPYLIDSDPNDSVPDYHPQAWSPAINAGENLTQFCNGWPQPGPVDGDPGVPAPALCQDKDGDQRPSNGGWDIGAYYFQGIRPQPGAPVAYGQSLYVTIGGTLNIALSVSDPQQGDPLSYAFTQPSNGGTLTGTAPNLVYTPPDQNLGIISDSFTFTVTDTKTGLVSNVAAVSITINNILVSLTSPDSTTGTNFNTGSNIPLAATASETGADAVAISKVDFYYGSTAIGTVTTHGAGNSASTYSMTWSNVQNGSYSITAQATDINGKIAVSPVVNVVVSSSPPNITSNLAGYWKFNEGTGTSVADSSGSGNTGTLVNGPTWVPGALAFTGGSFVSAGTNNIPAASYGSSVYPITVSAWIYTPSSSASGQIISRMDNINDLTNNVDWLLRFEGNNNHLVFYDISDANTGLYKVDSMVSITPNTWHHVAVTFDGASASIMNFYIDGVLTSSNASFAGWTGGDGPMGPITIGNASSASINDVRIYSRALAPQDVNALFSMGQTQAPTSLGDVNNDGHVTVYDAELTAQYAVGIQVANFNTTNAEVDGTGKVDIYDAFLIAEYAVGIINKFPVQQGG